MQKENPYPIKLDDYNRGLNDGLEHGKSARIKLNARIAELEAALKIYAEARCSGMICAFDDGEAARAAYLGEKE
jgi:hypothetical protein